MRGEDLPKAQAGLAAGWADSGTGIGRSQRPGAPSAMLRGRELLLTGQIAKARHGLIILLAYGSDCTGAEQGMGTDATFGRRAPGPRPGAPPPPRGMLPEPLSFIPAPIDAELKAEWAVRAASRPAPLLTLAIIAGLAIVFAAEYRFNVGPVQGMAPGLNSLVALGALSRKLVLGAGEPWRLVTAILLHLNPAHIIGNCIVLFLAGATLERLVGRAWLGAIFVVSGLAGALASMACNPAEQAGVGASGAIMGLISATFVLSFWISFSSIGISS